METGSNSQTTLRVKELEEEINQLNIHLKRYHFTDTPEQDFDIKSQLINKQNELIEILMKQRAEG